MGEDETMDLAETALKAIASLAEKIESAVEVETWDDVAEFAKTLNRGYADYTE